MVDVELQLQDRTVALSVPPLHAAVMALFEDTASLTVAEVAEKLQIASAVARRRLAFWVAQGVLADDGQDRFTVREVASRSDGDGSDGGDGNRHGGDVAMADGFAFGDDDNDDDDGAGDEDEEEEITAFALNMLTSQGSLSIDVIYARLALFLQPFRRTQQQVQAILMRLIEQERLELHQGLYRIRPR